MRAHKLIYKCSLASNMRPINVTLDSVTWEYAKEKTNFSAWVRDQLRSERNKRETSIRRIDVECVMSCGRPRVEGDMFCNTCNDFSVGEEE